MPASLLDSIQMNYNYWILQTIAMLVTCFLIRGLRFTNPFGPVLAVIALAWVNSVAWDAALFYKIPDEMSYKAVTLLLANGAIFWVVIKLMPGIEIHGVIPPLVAPVVFTVTSMLIDRYGRTIDWVGLYEAALNWVRGLKASIMSGSGNNGSSP